METADAGPREVDLTDLFEVEWEAVRPNRAEVCFVYTLVLVVDAVAFVVFGTTAGRRRGATAFVASAPATASVADTAAATATRLTAGVVSSVGATSFVGRGRAVAVGAAGLSASGGTTRPADSARRRARAAPPPTTTTRPDEHPARKKGSARGKKGVGERRSEKGRLGTEDLNSQPAKGFGTAERSAAEAVSREGTFRRRRQHWAQPNRRVHFDREIAGRRFETVNRRITTDVPIRSAVGKRCRAPPLQSVFEPWPGLGRLCCPLRTRRKGSEIQTLACWSLAPSGKCGPSVRALL